MERIDISKVLKGIEMDCVAIRDEKSYLPKVYACDGLRVKVSESFRKTLEHGDTFTLRVVEGGTKKPTYVATNVFGVHETKE